MDNFINKEYINEILENAKDATEEQVTHYINGNLCRCSGYIAQLEAIMAYMEVE